MHDARGLPITLRSAGFELVQQTTSLSGEQFYDNSATYIKTVYYQEMVELIKQHIGATAVKVLHHTGKLVFVGVYSPVSTRQISRLCNLDSL